MSEFLLLRHAKSDWSVRSDDFHRPLKKRGIKAAQRIGRWLKTHDLYPELIISSPAARALTTAEIVLEVLAEPQLVVTTEPRLYEADLSTLLGLVTELNCLQQSCLVVGHNPGMEQLLHYLSRDELSVPADGKLMPTASLALIDLPNRTDALLQHNGFVRQIVYARELPKIDS